MSKSDDELTGSSLASEGTSGNHDVMTTTEESKGIKQRASDVFSSEEDNRDVVPRDNVEFGPTTKTDVNVANPISEGMDSLNSNRSDEIILNKTDIFGESLSDLSGDEEATNDSNDRAASTEEEETKENEYLSLGNSDFSSTGFIGDGEQGPSMPCFGDSEQNDSCSRAEDRPPLKVKIPRIKVNLEEAMHFVKIPNFLNVEHRPFDSSTYTEEEGMSNDIDEIERDRLRLRLDNTIRWRMVNGEDGVPVKQSNCRFVQWSDGSLSLYVGNKPFDVFKNNISSDNNHLFVRHGSFLHGQDSVNTKLTFKPYLTDPAKSSRLITTPLSRQNNQSQQKIRILSTSGQNPDLNRIELIKQEEKRMKREERRRNLLEKRKEEARNATRRQISSQFLEREDSDMDSDVDEKSRARDEGSQDSNAADGYKEDEEESLDTSTKHTRVRGDSLHTERINRIRHVAKSSSSDES